MTRDGTDVDRMIQRAIAGEDEAIAWIVRAAEATTEVTVMALAAVLQWQVALLVRALAVATSRRDREVVAVAGAHLAGDHQLVDALARDHLVDHPDSFLVAWIAADAVLRARPTDGS
jgi:hypothetical protein